jgi:hypothetical protein
VLALGLDHANLLITKACDGFRPKIASRYLKSVHVGVDVKGFSWNVSQQSMLINGAFQNSVWGLLELSKGYKRIICGSRAGVRCVMIWEA